MVLDGRRGVGIPTAAIAQRGGNSAIFVVELQTARMLPVQTGRSMSGWTEILDGGLSVGAEVITMGQQLVNDGTPVAVAKEDSR